jgi:hypothetical protein
MGFSENIPTESEGLPDIVITTEVQLAEMQREFDTLYERFPNPIRGGPVTQRLNQLSKAIEGWYTKRRSK